MAVEREVKIKLNSHKLDEIISFLGEPKYFEQTNLIYQNHVGFLRLRKEKDKTVITYKGPRRNDKIGSREELEVSLEGEEQFEILRLILGKMGMSETLYYDKRRAEYSLGSCKICLDSTRVGNFIEIEGDYQKNIEQTMAFFGFHDKDIEKRSYLELLKEATK